MLPGYGVKDRPACFLPDTYGAYFTACCQPAPWRPDSYELGDRLAQAATVAVMLDLDVVTGGLFIPHAAAVAFLPTALERAKALCLAALGPLRADEGSHRLRLMIFQPPLAAIRLDQPDDEQVVVVRMKDVEVQAGVAMFPIQVCRVHKGEGDAV